MKTLRTPVSWRWLGVLTICCVMAVGCAYNDAFEAPPSPLSQLAEVADVLQTVNDRGYGELSPDRVAALQARYKEARFEYYSSRTQASSEMSMSIIADANALMAPRPNQAPVARFSGPATGRALQSLLFDASTSVDPEGDPLIYMWDFGDGTTQRVLWPQAEHRFAVARTHIVRLTVSDHQGESDTASQVITIAQPIMIPRPAIVLFEFDSADMQANAMAQLGEVVQAMKQQPTLEADVVGHADAQGTESYNLALSQRRAQAVSDYLTTSSVAASRINTKWRGESEPAFPNTTAEFRALNRRVEVTLRPPM